MRWADLKPDAAMVASLDAADAVVARAVAIAGAREPRHKWSNAFADACSRMIASSPPFRGRPVVSLTWSTVEFVEAMVQRVAHRGSAPMVWSEPEDD